MEEYTKSISISVNGDSLITVIPREIYNEGDTLSSSWHIWLDYAGNDDTPSNWYFGDIRVGDIGNYAKYHTFVKVIHVCEEPHHLYGHFIAVQSSWEEATEKLRKKLL